jgi:hypothetical protein
MFVLIVSQAEFSPSEHVLDEAALRMTLRLRYRSFHDLLKEAGTGEDAR